MEESVPNAASGVSSGALADLSMTTQDGRSKRAAHGQVANRAEYPNLVA